MSINHFYRLCIVKIYIYLYYHLPWSRFTYYHYCILSAKSVCTTCYIYWFIHFKHIDLVYFTTQVPETSDTNDTSATRAVRLHRKCDRSVTRITRVQQERCMNDTSATRVKKFDFDNKTSENTLILVVWQMKDYKEKNSFILRTTFWKCLSPMPKCIWKVHRKNWIL